jgi:hypothetical protein
MKFKIGSLPFNKKKNKIASHSNDQKGFHEALSYRISMKNEGSFFRTIVIVISVIFAVKSEKVIN